MTVASRKSKRRDELGELKKKKKKKIKGRPLIDDGRLVVNGKRIKRPEKEGGNDAQEMARLPRRARRRSRRSQAGI